MRTFALSLVLALGGFCASAESAPVPIDTGSALNGITEIYSATFDGALSPCGAGSPSYCSFFSGEPPPAPPATRSMIISPNPSTVVNGVPDGIGPGLPPVSPPQPVPAAGSFLNLTRAPGNTSVTLAGGVVKLPDFPLVIRNETVVDMSGAGFVFDAAPQTVPLDANGVGEFLVDLSPAIAVDLSAFTVVATNCSGSLCSLIQILTLDMIRYRLLIDYDPTFTTFTASFIGQTANHSLVYATLNSGAPVPSSVPLTLVADNTRTNSGTLSFQAFRTCAPATGNGCYNPNNPWAIANGVTGSDATWTWDGTTLTGTGTFWTTSFLGSNPSASSVISDKTLGLVIDTMAQTTTATSYHCVEGNFLAGVGANGCLNISTGNDFVTNSSALYNVGGNANCVQRTVAGDDTSTGNPRGLFSAAAVGACDAVDGAYDLYTVVEDNTATGGNLIISNGIPLGNCLTLGCSAEPASAGAHWLTFAVDSTPEATANDDGPVDVQQAVPTSIAVLANDTGFSDPVTVTVSTAPVKGSATVIGTSPGAQAGISIRYTANTGATGTDTFVYTVQDAGHTDTATATVNILPNGPTPGVALTLLTDNLRSAAGVVSFLAFKTCAPAPGNGCYNPNNAWVVANGVTGSDATWSWDGTTLTASGTFWTTTFLSSSPNGSAIVSDRTVNLAITPATMTTAATSYECVEGNFLVSVGANGCLNTTTGPDFLNQSSAVYNVGGDANCVQRTVAGDDTVNGNLRGLFTAGAIGICDPVAGAYGLYTVVEDNTATGGNLVISNGIPVGNCLTFGCPAEPAFANAHWLTFAVVPSSPDTTPAAFAFNDQTSVPLDTVITSNAITITGINAPTPISVTGGEYSINGGSFTAVAGVVSDGNTVQVRHTSSPAPGTAVDTVLDVGGVIDTFTSTTLRYALDDSVVAGINPVQIDVLQNDAGLLGTVYVGIWTNPVHGSVVVSGSPGSPSGIRITYTPSPGYIGPDSFEYWLETGLVIDYAVVNVDVVNDDDDGDGVANSLDNCTVVANPGQCDSDGDGYGNHCDGDLTNNGVTNAQDYLVLRGLLGGISAAPDFSAADFNCNGFVNAQDYVLFRRLLGQPSGPSGLAP